MIKDEVFAYGYHNDDADGNARAMTIILRTFVTED